MAFQLCPRCRRANPGEATFCHHDGAELRAVVSVSARGGELGREFIFPTGRRCRTYDDLVRGCSEEWNAAREMLRQGGLRQFLAGVGRMDLARVAQDAATHPDLDIALDNFLSQLPTSDLDGPRLDLRPRRINVGKITVGESRQVQLTILNQGTRLLHGSIQVEGGDWIRPGQLANGLIPIKTGKQQQLTLQIDTFGLVAGQQYTAKLTVITNGGVTEVPISMDVVAIPFPKPPLQGATSPRDLASRMKDHPKVVSPFLESGEVLRWFQANGWQYPVAGPAAKGIAAIQQFFEGLGVSKPPKIIIENAPPTLTVYAGRRLRAQLTMRTQARKWVYAQVESDSSWLTVLTPDVGGAQEATIEFEINTAGLGAKTSPASGTGVAPVLSKVYDSQLRILANGGQKFAVPVRVEVQTLHISLAQRFMRLALIGALAGMLARVLISLPDPFTRGWESFGAWLQETPEFFVAKFAIALAWLGCLAGAWLLWRRGGLLDVIPGTIVGGVTALVGAATLAFVLQMIDAPLAAVLPLQVPGIAIVGWGLVGAGLTLLLGVMGVRGRAIVTALGRPFAWCAQKLGLNRLADLLLNG